MTGWRSRYDALVASDVHERDGLGWEFTDPSSGEAVWAVFREDGGPFPVFSATRGHAPLPPQDDLEAMTGEAVADLMSAAGLTDATGWESRNITGALLLASCEVLSWEGEEWATEWDDCEVATAWAAPDDRRIPFAWLRARCTGSERLISTYQDDAAFGLFFTSAFDPRLPGADVGLLRSRTQIDLALGQLRAVEVVYDTVVEGGRAPGLVTEVLLHGADATTLLIAAEAYGTDEWHLYDESVVALPGTADADALEWIPPRTSWRSGAATDS